MRILVSNDLAHFSVIPELNEIKSQKSLPFDFEDLSTDGKTGVVMLGQRPARFMKLSEFTWFDFFKDEPWVDLPISALPEWIEYLYEIPVRPKLVWDESARKNEIAWREVLPIPQLRFEISRTGRDSASFTRGTNRVVPVFQYPSFEVTLNDRASHQIFAETRTIELRNRKAEEAALMALFEEATATSAFTPVVETAHNSRFKFAEIQRERRKITRIEVAGEHLRLLMDRLLSAGSGSIGAVLTETLTEDSSANSPANSPADSSTETSADALPDPTSTSTTTKGSLNLAPISQRLKLQGKCLLSMRELALTITSASAGVLLSGSVEFGEFGEFQIPIQDMLSRLDFAVGTVELQADNSAGPLNADASASPSRQITATHNEASTDTPEFSAAELSASAYDAGVGNAVAKSEAVTDSSIGILGFVPTRALARLTALLSLGTETKTGIRFTSAQLPILAALFAGDAIAKSVSVQTAGTIETRMDAPFRAMVEKFIRHREAKPKPSPAGFRGKLRHYQEEGFGWLSFLSDTGFGGILADDMGLGKTVQLIAHLTDQYEKNPKAPLTLVVLPKSLLFNWDDEIRKFSPQLKCAIYEGSQKRPLFSQIRGLNVLLVTYNTLRQDIEALSAIPYHYVILDEAQAIKNATSQVHRACLQLKARHRLAVSGTPVENSVMDLFAIFDFVAPGLLSGRLKQKALQLSMQSGGDLTALGLALKPFILRRTKEEVLKDLPPKVEKVIYCKLSGAELKRYQAIRDFHKKKVQDTVASQGISKSGFAVLEGLLRLRQAASHAGLVDKKWLNESSAKLDSFMEQLQTVLDSGHKALVFSQFTGLLDIVEKKLERAGINQLRIDGSCSSNQRRESVKEFQTNDKMDVFLISLKAGGTGLNLTAAGYVFILDPWWNPAAESQAIDRAHRMGQQNRVFAYRMITKGTVEEKILELQKTKRDLATALVSSDAGMLKSLSHEDIEALFS